jgi:hypothetical protein
MSKFSSFIVFAFSIVILVVIAVTMVRRAVETNVEKQERLGIVKTELVPCDLPALEIGTQEQFHQQLDRLFDAGGITAVRDFVTKEFVPGRGVSSPSNVPGEPPIVHLLVDREIRRCNDEGVIIMDMPPVLPRLATNMKLGNDALIHRWSRTSSHSPYHLTVWWVRRTAQ